MSADDAGISPVEQESPGNTPPSAPATAQLDSVRQGWIQVVSPTHAQKSPGRASSKVGQRSAVAAASHERQYHARHVQYQRHSTARSSPRALVMPTASISFGEPARITRSSSPIESPSRSGKASDNCAQDPYASWAQDLPADDAESVECATDQPADQVTSGDPSNSALCADPAAQYQPDETQYQTPAATCDPANESPLPISEPDVPVPSTTGSSDAAPPPSVVPPTTPTTPTTPPTTEPVAAPVVPEVEPTQPTADVPPAPPAAQPVTMLVATSRPVHRPSRPESESRGPAAPTARVTPARVRPSTQTLPVRSRPVRSPGAKSTTSVARSRVEAAPPQSLVPASAHGNLLGDWLLLVLPLSFVVALALLFPAGALVGRSLRARVGSKGLSGDRGGSNSSAGIRYRD